MSNNWVYKRFSLARPDYKGYIAVCDKRCPFLFRGQKLKHKKVDICCFDDSSPWYFSPLDELENHICLGWVRILMQEVYNLHHEQKQTREFMLQQFLKSAMEEMNEAAPEDLQIDNETPKA